MTLPDLRHREPPTDEARPKLRVLDLFSGVGMFSLGLERTGGFETVAFSEVAEFPNRVREQHWPDVPNLGDITKADFTEGMADVVCGGFPCQDLSNAGARAGLAGERSGLYRELVRAIRVVRPQYAILENVAALLHRGMGEVLGDLAEIGADTEWDCVPACAVGAPHERDRVWIVAHADREHGRGGAGRQDGAQTGDGAATSQKPAAFSYDEGVRWRESWQSKSAVNGAASNATCQQAWLAGQPRGSHGLEAGGRELADTKSLGCRSGRTRRPSDSFARIRDEARRNAADPYSARLAFGRVGQDAYQERKTAQRNTDSNIEPTVWPREPALLGMDDECANRMDRVKALGNGLIPKIPELIGQAILKAEGLR